MPLVFNTAQLTGYNCNLCNGYNDITQHGYCIYCQDFNGSNLTEQQVQISYAIREIRTGEFYGMANNNDIIELHSKFFNAESVEIRNLNAAEREERHESLRAIIFEAKARKSAHDLLERELNAEKAKQNKDWILSSKYNDPNVTDAINAVKERKARMSKADKLKNTLINLGVANADSIVAQVVKNQTGAAITSAPGSAIPRKERFTSQTTSAYCLGNSHKGCTGSFRLGGEAESRTCDCKCHKPKVAVDLSKISFKPKG